MNRTLNLLNAFGFQGGTVHQVTDLIGCSVHDVLYADIEQYSEAHSLGWFAYRSCSAEFNQQFLVSMRGNVQFWLGVAQGVEATRKQELQITKKF